nr:response regulator transcription factor [Actibacterium mucosum]
MPPRDIKTALIIEDHPLYSDALSLTLQAVAGVQTQAVAPSLADGLAVLADGPAADMVTLDLGLPDVDGMDGLARLVAATDAPVLVVSSLADDRVITTALKAGAAGYVPKHSSRDVFRTAIEHLTTGRSFVPLGCITSDQTDEADEPAHVAAERLATLTPQQTRILQLICEGKLNKQIAWDLSIAETTVKAHVTAIMRKLGVQSRTQAVLLTKQASFSTLLQRPPPPA